MSNFSLVIIALVLDAILGEPRRFHPLVGFGQLAQKLETRVNKRARRSELEMRIRGVVSVLIIVVPFVLGAWILSQTIGVVVDIILLYLAIGWKSLAQHARKVRDALLDNDIIEARRNVSLMVSRDTKELNSQEISKATVETVLENGNDAIFGALFWFLLAGAPGVVAFRLINTLDAMWGYRNERFLFFGWAAAKLDDAMNYIPARLTALSYALAGNTRHALRCWRKQGRIWKSPNAGPVMAAGAGSIGVKLGGPASYHGEIQLRPMLGKGLPPTLHHIDASLKLIALSMVIWVFVIAGGTVVFALL